MPSGQEEAKGLNILCMDGGGVRGLSSLIILREIMHRIENVNERRNVHPHEHFDVIAGTGTGGISACMLGRLRMSVGKAIEEYVKLMKEAFSEKKLSGSTMYKGTKLQGALKMVVRDATGDEGEMMMESRVDGGCNTTVFAMARHHLNAGFPVMFRSYAVTSNPGPNCTIWQALYATMAHPDLFKGIDIADSSVSQSFIGGEIGCSNPLAHVLSEVKRIYPDRHVACIVSIGTGHARTIEVPNPSRWSFASRAQDVVVMKDMAMDSERVAEEMALRFQHTNGVYFRLNVDQGMQDMRSGSLERLSESLQHTNAYLQKLETNQRLEGAIRASVERRSIMPTTHAAGQVSGVLEPTKGPMGLKRCPAPTKLYTGRNEENAYVMTCIMESKVERRVCVVYGLGGTGKTQLVLNAIERTWDEWDHIIYVDASSKESVEKAFKEFALAKVIGQTHEDTLGWLDSCRERWLVVFDNADTPSTNIRQYMPTRARRGCVFITTRLSDLARLAEGPNSVCHLSSMSQVDGLALLVKSVSLGGQTLSDTDLVAAEALVKDFGCLALAIVHAGAYIAHSPGVTITKYQTLFLSQRRRMLEEYNGLPLTAKLDDYGNTVYTTWRMCYDQLMPESRPLLWLIAYLHYDGIFEDMFKKATLKMRSKEYTLPLNNIESQAQNHLKQYLTTFLDPDGQWDTVKFTKVMADLVSYSLVEFDRVNLSYRVHVLVHDWARTVVPQTPNLAIECTAKLLSLSTSWEEDAASLAFKRRLGLHVTSVLAHNPGISANNLNSLRYVYAATGQYRQKAKLEQQLLEVFQRELGDSTIDTWQVMNELAFSYSELGQRKESGQLQVQVVDAYKRLKGERHTHTLRAIGSLAKVYTDMGRLNEAEQLQIEVLVAHKELQGGEHPDTLIGMNNLAATYASQGRYDEAGELQIQVLEARIRLLGEEHPSTLISMNNLAMTYSDLGQWGEAEGLYGNAIRIAERTLGAEHPSTCVYRRNLENLLTKKQME